MDNKKIIFSGVQPTGNLTIGNYLGALRNMVTLQEDYDCIYCVVDLHSITVRQEPAALRQNTLKVLALYLACGLSPDKSVIFLQSHVPQHAELTWVLNCLTYIGEINRMTQFKDKIRKHADNINVGLLDYPVLMASDILLYNTDVVPVGADQKQHLELSRTLAERFNSAYSPTFTVPEPYIAKVGAKIMSLQDPTKKMSKSDENENGFIAMSDDRATVLRKLKRAVTDSDNRIIHSSSKPGVSNLLEIYSLFSGCTVAEAEKKFAGVGYGEFKEQVAEAISNTLEPIQAKQQQLLADKAYLEQVLKNGAEQAERRAAKTLAKVYKKVGFIPKIY